MTLDQAGLFILTLAMAILAPGPAIIAATQTAFARGREAALPYGLGLAVGASLWCLFALLGLTVLFSLVPAIFIALKVLGGLYLLWFAWRLWRDAPEPMPDAASGRRSFWGGIALNLSNPKPALFYSAVILSIFPGQLGHGAQAAIYGVALATELSLYASVVLVMSLPFMRARYAAAKLWIDRVASGLMAALGLSLIIRH
ncbi:LysE family translocator [Paracoccus pacificus]|uniref:LysE family translocator n=1 Tax=Paracoccus pacificus TaxID=1463598 RepID=A0ABW4R2E6_9RHOB